MVGSVRLINDSSIDLPIRLIYCYRTVRDFQNNRIRYNAPANITISVMRHSDARQLLEQRFVNKHHFKIFIRCKLPYGATIWKRTRVNQDEMRQPSCVMIALSPDRRKPLRIGPPREAPGLFRASGRWASAQAKM